MLPRRARAAVYGHIQTGGGHLRLEAQSRTRLQLGRGLLEAHAGRLLKHQGDSHLSLDEFKQRVASGKAPERDERDPNANRNAKSFSR